MAHTENIPELKSNKSEVIQQNIEVHLLGVKTGINISKQRQ